MGKELDACEVGYSGNPQQRISWISCERMIEHHEHVGLLEITRYDFVSTYDSMYFCDSGGYPMEWPGPCTVIGNMMINRGVAG